MALKLSATPPPPPSEPVKKKDIKGKLPSGRLAEVLASIRKDKGDKVVVRGITFPLCGVFRLGSSNLISIRAVGFRVGATALCMVPNRGTKPISA